MSYCESKKTVLTWMFPGLHCASPRDLWAKKAELLLKDSVGIGYGSGLVQKL